MNPAAVSGKVFVPPRPNLGPEPWSQTSETIQLAVWFGLILSVVVMAALFVKRLRRSRQVNQTRPGETTPALPDSSPPARLLALALEVREALALKFGPSMRALTTEEISEDPRVRSTLGTERHRNLVRLLRATDQLKFAPELDAIPQHVWLDELANWNTGLEDFRSTLASGG